MDITERAKFGISYAFQQPVRFKGITVRDLLELASGGQMKEETICEILAKVGLCTKDYIDREVNASLSGGEIKRIEIATVLARRNSRLIIFDEPEAGIDLWSFSGLIDTFGELKKDSDKALLVISHQERLLEIADEIAVIVDRKGPHIRTGERDHASADGRREIRRLSDRKGVVIHGQADRRTFESGIRIHGRRLSGRLQHQRKRRLRGKAVHGKYTDRRQGRRKRSGHLYQAGNQRGKKYLYRPCVTRGNVNDLVYNDFHVGENADVTIIAGCGVHTDDEGEAAHNGIHSFYLEKGARVLYEEKHLGTGEGSGQKKIDPVTHVELAEDSVLEMNTIQLGGVDHSVENHQRNTVRPGKADHSREHTDIRQRIREDGF